MTSHYAVRAAVLKALAKNASAIQLPHLAHHLKLQESSIITPASVQSWQAVRCDSRTVEVTALLVAGL
jgi:hypothetical protein